MCPAFPVFLLILLFFVLISLVCKPILLYTNTYYVSPVILLSSTVLTTEMCIGKYLGQDFRTLNILIKILLSLDKAAVVKGIIFHLYILSTVKCAIIISAVKQVLERKMDLRSKRL